jgi:hypothetical protein
MSTRPFSGTVRDVEGPRIFNTLNMLAVNTNNMAEGVSGTGTNPALIDQWRERSVRTTNGAFGNGTPLVLMVEAKTRESERLFDDRSVAGAMGRAVAAIEVLTLNAIRELAMVATYAASITPASTAHPAIAENLSMAIPLIRKIVYREIHDAFGDEWGDALLTLAPVLTMIEDAVEAIEGYEVDLEWDLKSQEHEATEEPEFDIATLLGLIDHEEYEA